MSILLTMTAAFVIAASPAFAQTIGVSCALPYRNGADQACVGQHNVVIQTRNTDSSAKITAELLGLDTKGNLIGSLSVANGDRVQLGSRVSPSDWKFNENKNMSQVFAPVPLLRVTVENKGQKAVAYCSNIPYVQVIQPTGGVVSESAGNTTAVVAAAPLTDPSKAQLFVDGVDLLSKVPNFQACTATSPCNGTATINGQSVGYSNLVVDVAWNIETPASNTIRVNLTNLSCGGHVFRVSSTKTPGYPAHVSGACNTDSLSKSAGSSVFAINIADPTPNKITTSPTPVKGEVCSGTPVTNVSINGKVLPVNGAVFTPGDGVTKGDVYKVPIDTLLDQTDLVRDAFGTKDAPLGTFDAGTNRLAASAREAKGNRTFKNFIFATGNVAPVAIATNAKVFQKAAIEDAVSGQLQELVESNLKQTLNGPTSTELANAFVVGLSASGAQTLFNKLCTSPVPSPDPSINGLTPGQIFSKKVKEAILAIPGTSVSVPSPCSCDPNVGMNITKVDVGSNVACNVAFSNGSFKVTMGLPDVKVTAQAKGWCKTEAAGACVEGLAVAVEGSAAISGIRLEFDVTEANLLDNTTSPSAFFKGTTSTSAKDITNHFGDQGISFCGLSVVCDVLVNIFTFGALDLTPTIDISKVQDFSGQIGASQPDPVKLKQIKVDEGVVANFDQKLSGAVSSVKITPSGITAGLKGTFASLAVDPLVPSTPGVTLTPAPVPTLPVPNAKDIFVGISDDAINMMFASLTQAGKFQTGAANGNGCVDTGATVGTLLPTDCNSLNLDNDLATVGARAYCHAIRGNACGSLTYNNPALSATDNANLTATERGICFGAQGLPAGQSCGSVANGNLVLFGSCSITPNFNLKAAQPLLFCAKGDVPPRMLFPEGGSASAVPAVLRVPSLSVSLIVDRDQNHQTAGAMVNTPGCFDSANNLGDCNVFSACLSLNLNFTMGFKTCNDGKPGFTPNFQNVQVLARQVGTVCGGSTSPTSDSSVLEQSSSQQITIPLGQNGAGFAPPICGAGLDLGGFVQCTAPGVLSIKTGNYPESRDYLAVTCQVQ